MTTDPDDWDARLEDLRRVGELQDDWDGEGSLAPGWGLADSAKDLAGVLRALGVPAPDRVIAGVNATIFFEWREGDEYREIEVFEPDRASVVLVAPDGRAEVRSWKFGEPRLLEAPP